MWRLEEQRRKSFGKVVEIALTIDISDEGKHLFKVEELELMDDFVGLRTHPETEGDSDSSAVVHYNANSFWTYVGDTQRELDGIEIFDPWTQFKKNFQLFPRQVGCAAYYDKPKENVAELQRFNSKAMGCFGKLQDKYT
ncbi:MAG: hypothetical protein M1814_003555 [Vezdaea aestivalis]|nr:MAG: hypothetical protein M1814_003555 [Vezdaea aestivalis]